MQTQAVNAAGTRERTPATARFIIEATSFPPNTSISSPTIGQNVSLTRSNTTITVRGTATDSGGSLPGVQSVKVIVENLDHGEYFCGPPGCNSFTDDPNHRWTTAKREVNAALSGTNWTLSVPLFNHSHNYRVTAYAIDRNGKADQSRAVVTFRSTVQ